MQNRLKASEVERLRLMIREMSYDSLLYRLLKEELSARGHWKAAPRGKPSIANLNGTSPRETNYSATDD